MPDQDSPSADADADPAPSDLGSPSPGVPSSGSDPSTDGYLAGLNAPSGDPLADRLGQVMRSIVGDPYGTGDHLPGADPLTAILRGPPIDPNRPGLLGSSIQLAALGPDDARRPYGQASIDPDPSLTFPSGPAINWTPPAKDAQNGGATSAYGDGPGQIRADPAPRQWDFGSGLLGTKAGSPGPSGASASDLDALAKIFQPPQVAPKGPQYPNSLDPLIEQDVADYNLQHGFQQGDAEYLDPDLVKAIVRQEAGSNSQALASDPMTVNGPDWDNRKVAYGLSKGIAPGAELGISAGIGWLGYKSYEYNNQGKPIHFLGWPAGVAAYNQRNAAGQGYSRSVMIHLADIKAGR